MKKAQNIVEYALLFVFVALIAYALFSNVDIKRMKNFIFKTPVQDGNTITIEAMT